ncbi:MAG: hypothetical protein M4D85_12960 [Actinomycetota bacterium]|nr:hypothetical protein [Actinomycetota bacterium]
MATSLQTRWAIALAGLAVWAAVVPWLARAVGLELDVATRLEIVDHVVPAVVMLAGAAMLATRAGAPGGRVWLGAGGIAFLTGLWITATHLPLIPDAFDSLAPWGVALLHLSTGPPILVCGLWMVLRTRPSDVQSSGERGAHRS